MTTLKETIELNELSPDYNEGSSLDYFGADSMLVEKKNISIDEDLYIFEGVNGERFGLLDTQHRCWFLCEDDFNTICSNN
jgi:hypothetical protein